MTREEAQKIIASLPGLKWPCAVYHLSTWLPDCEIVSGTSEKGWEDALANLLKNLRKASNPNPKPIVSNQALCGAAADQLEAMLPSAAASAKATACGAA